MGKSTHFIGQPMYNQVIKLLDRSKIRDWPMLRINLMYYVDFYSLFNNPEKDWETILENTSGPPPLPSLFD